MTNQPYIISAGFNEQGQMEIVTRYPSNTILTSCPPQKAPDRIVRDVYGVVSGAIKLVKTFEGMVEPAQLREERVVWSNEPEGDTNG